MTHSAGPFFAFELIGGLSLRPIPDDGYRRNATFFTPDALQMQSMNPKVPVVA
jgi:hypothetical protein